VRGMKWALSGFGDRARRVCSPRPLDDRRGGAVMPLAGDRTAFPAAAAFSENERSGFGDNVDDGYADGGATRVAGAAQCYSPGVTSTFVGLRHGRRE